MLSVLLPDITGRVFVTWDSVETESKTELCSTFFYHEAIDTNISDNSFMVLCRLRTIKFNSIS